MFARSQEFYDAIYEANGKDYAAECEDLIALISRYRVSSSKSMLEVACGTGSHTDYLKEHFDVVGVDLDAGMIEIAKKRLPGVVFHVGDMVDLSLGRTFDVVVCLASAIGYASALPEMRQAIKAMADHLAPGGILLVEPWLGPEEYEPKKVFSVFVNKPDLKIVRMNVNEIRERTSVLKFNYLVASPTGVEHFTELHELGLYTRAEYEEAFRACGLETMFDDRGLIGRGMLIGRKVRPQAVAAN
jgi:SAM-dependent methyltransferase